MHLPNENIMLRSRVVLKSNRGERVFEPPPGREVGELSANPFGLCILSLVERRTSIALRGTETNGFGIVGFVDLNAVASTCSQAELIFYKYIAIPCPEMSSLFVE
jgi:hypothetical protein